MIFPSVLDKITFYMPTMDVYHELVVSSSSTQFDLERYSEKVGLSGKIYARVRGFRFSMDIQIDQTSDHSGWNDFLNDLREEHVTNEGEYIDLYLTDETTAQGVVSPVRIYLGEAVASSSYSSTIGRHGYRISVKGHLPEEDLALGEISFVIDNNGDFVITSGGDFVIVEATFG